MNIEIKENIKPFIFNDDEPLPDLSISKQTMARLASILLGGGADNHAFENGCSKKISAKLSSGKDGFLNETEFPRKVAL